MSARVLFAGGGTGGHLYPALALADALRALRPDVETHFVGARRGVEARVLPEKGVPHTLLPFEPIRRDQVWRNWRLIPATIRSVSGLRGLFGRFRPQLVVGTGGYASGFAGAYAIAAGVPVAIQEQNSYPGVTQKLLARRARQVHLGFPEAERELSPGERTEIYSFGNPIQPPDASLERAPSRAAFGLKPEGTVALVMGGSQGAKAVNDALIDALEKVARGELSAPPADFQLLWATGPAHYDALEARLRPLALPWVHAVGYITEMPKALAGADVAVSRAGAMATAELLAWGIPAILVPLPTAAADHQRLNAEALEGAGAAIHLPQSELSAERIWRDLLSLAADDARRDAMAAAAKQRGNAGAARAIAEKLLELLEAA